MHVKGRKAKPPPSFRPLSSFRRKPESKDWRVGEHLSAVLYFDV